MTATIEISPKWEDSYHDRAAMYYELGNYEQSIVDFEKFLELNPNAADRQLIEATLQEMKAKVEQ